MRRCRSAIRYIGADLHTSRKRLIAASRRPLYLAAFGTFLESLRTAQQDFRPLIDRPLGSRPARCCARPCGLLGRLLHPLGRLLPGDRLLRFLGGLLTARLAAAGHLEPLRLVQHLRPVLERCLQLRSRTRACDQQVRLRVHRAAHGRAERLRLRLRFGSGHALQFAREDDPLPRNACHVMAPER